MTLFAFVLFAAVTSRAQLGADAETGDDAMVMDLESFDQETWKEFEKLEALLWDKLHWKTNEQDVDDESVEERNPVRAILLIVIAFLK